MQECDKIPLSIFDASIQRILPSSRRIRKHLTNAKGGYDIDRPICRIPVNEENLYFLWSFQLCQVTLKRIKASFQSVLGVVRGDDY
jgi:hypothetical protein